MNARDVFANWSQVRTDLYQALDMLTDEQLRFVPREGLWSLGATACHIASTEEGWLRHAVEGRRPPTWDSVTLEAYPTVASLKAALAEVHARTEAWLETLDADDLDRQFTTPHWGGKFSLGWAVWHVLEHEIHHRGEIYLMLGLMGLEAPDV